MKLTRDALYLKDKQTDTHTKKKQLLDIECGLTL